MKTLFYIITLIVATSAQLCETFDLTDCYTTYANSGNQIAVYSNAGTTQTNFINSCASNGITVTTQINTLGAPGIYCQISAANTTTVIRVLTTNYIPVSSSAPPVSSSAPPVSSSAPPVSSSAPPVSSSAPPVSSSIQSSSNAQNYSSSAPWDTEAFKFGLNIVPYSLLIGLAGGLAVKMIKNSV